MPLTRFKLSSIGDGGITTAKLADGAVTKIKTDSLFTNAVFDGTHMKVPVGTTAERPASPESGYIRFNTTESSIEQYNGIGWSVLASPPVISSVSPTDTNGDSGTVVTINGNNFTSESTVTFITQGGAGTEYASGTTTFINSTQVTATFPQNFVLADEPLDVKLATSVGENTLEDAITLGGTPTWTTTGGSLGSGVEGEAFSVTLVAVDPEGGDVDYALTSGAFPTGITLNTETGVVSGTFTASIRSAATSTAVITPSDSAGNDGSTRTFSITQNGDGDSNFPYVRTRLTGNGTDGADNDVATADDVAGLSGSVNSLPAVGQFNPYHPEGYWGVSFDGTDDVLNFNSNGMALGTGDFTIEHWLKTHVKRDYQSTVSNYDGTNGAYIHTTAQGYIGGGTNGSNFAVASVQVCDNEWHHIAFQRVSGAFYMYVDGTEYNLSTSDSTNISTGATGYIGNLNGFSRYFEGQIADVRVSNTARYSGSYTVPTAPLTSDGNTLLLTCSSAYRKDKSSNGYGVTVGGGQPSIVPMSPYLLSEKRDLTTGSVYFDAGDDKITYAEDAAFQWGTGDGTWEFWAYIPQDVPLQDYWTAIAAMNGDGISQDGITVYVGNTNSSSLIGAINIDIGGNRILGDFDARGQWNHIAVTRSGSTVTLYVNGQSQGTTTSSTDMTSGNGFGLLLGLSKESEGNWFRGAISDMRVVKGNAVYTSTFTPPTSPVGSSETGTSFYKQFNDAGIKDDTGIINWGTYGSAQVDTSDKKYGSGSIFLNTTDGISTSNGVLFALNHKHTKAFDFAGSWTIEYWFKGPSGNGTTDGPYRRVFDFGGNNSWGALQILVDIGTTYSSGAGSHFIYDNSTQAPAGFSGSGQPNVCDNQWHHLAFTYDGSTIREYTDGTLYATRAVSNAVWRHSTQGNAPTIGADSTNWGQSRTVGRIDDIRITHGIARYTGSSYTVPTGELPVW